ncbi:DNA primase family protein [Rhodoblastus sp.]|uniref:DNA primase family protein n=1 Tax=Rhodoblastus sp. TaxID=1962975 RepID=UPI0025D09C4C|nr:DNA primase family protein [Rhodoblastus sp.]
MSDMADGPMSAEEFAAHTTTARADTEQREVEVKAKVDALKQARAAVTSALSVERHVNKRTLDVARTFIEGRHTQGGVRMLQYVSQTFYSFNGKVYEFIPDDYVKAELHKYMENAKYPVIDEKTKEVTYHYFDMDARSEGNWFNAIKRQCTPQGAKVAFNTWLPGAPEDAPPGDRLLVFNNCMLNWETMTTLEHTPLYFTTILLPYAYEPDAKSPLFDGFLCDLFNTQESRDCLVEAFGYYMTPLTFLQKMIGMFGDPRAGKGVATRLLQHLTGEMNCKVTNLSDFGSHYGMQKLIGCRAVFFPDVRANSKNQNVHVAIERILSIVGEDGLSIPVKYKEDFCDASPFKIFMVANGPPKLADDTQALIARMIALKTANSFVGREDKDLFSKLVKELPGIANRALAGLKTLLDRGRFIQPVEGLETLKEIEQALDHIALFLAEECVIEKDASVIREDIYAAYCVLCDKIKRVPDLESKFGRFVAKAVRRVLAEELGEDLGEELKDAKNIRDGKGGWTKVYFGVRLKTAEERQSMSSPAARQKMMESEAQSRLAARTAIDALNMEERYKAKLMSEGERDVEIVDGNIVELKRPS